MTGLGKYTGLRSTVGSGFFPWLSSSPPWPPCLHSFVCLTVHAAHAVLPASLGARHRAQCAAPPSLGLWGGGVCCKWGRGGQGTLAEGRSEKGVIFYLRRKAAFCSLRSRVWAETEGHVLGPPHGVWGTLTPCTAGPLEEGSPKRAGRGDRPQKAKEGEKSCWGNDPFPKPRGLQ